MEISCNDIGSTVVRDLSVGDLAVAVVVKDLSVALLDGHVVSDLSVAVLDEYVIVEGEENMLVDDSLDITD